MRTSSVAVIGVFACVALLTATSAAAASSCENAALGPTPTTGGYCFAVWAPHASSASVEPKNGASFGSTSMTFNSTAGVYTAFVEGAKVGDAYVYVFDGSTTRLDPRAQDIAAGTNDFSYSQIHDPNYSWRNTATLPGPSKAIIYEMHIPSFNADGGMGTFASAQEKLSYLADLGITMIELMPVATFCDQADGWGYNPCAPYAVMDAFGGSTGLKSFVDAAASFNIGVMLDVVWNHADGGNILEKFDTYAGSAGNGIYFYESSNTAETFWGPRPDFSTPQVATYILDSIKMWVEEYHIAGFRWDSTICIRKPAQSCWTQSANLDAGWELMQQANLLTLQLQPLAVTAAEDTQGWSGITAPVSDKSTGYPDAPGGAGFVSQWGYVDFFYSFFTQLTEANNQDVDMSTVAGLASTSTEGTRVLFTENHDMASNQNHGRIPAIVNPGGNPANPSYWAMKKSMLGMGVIFTAPGIPMILQGQEFLSYATFQFPSPPALDWSLVQSNAGLVNEVRDMMRLRTNANNTSLGLTSQNAKTIQVVNTADSKVAVVYRWSDQSGPGQHVLVVYNMYNSKCASFEITGIPMDGRWNVLFNGDLTQYSSQYANCGASQTSVVASNGAASVQLPEYSMLILALQS